MNIVTHSGKFHADDCVAIAILKAIYPDSTVTRSRDLDVIRDADIAVDVGGGTYDHHQRGGNGSRPRRDAALGECNYAAAGLVWRDYGEYFLNQMGFDEAHTVKELHRLVDHFYIQQIDDIDNGVNAASSPISSIVNELNFLENGFEKAVDICGDVTRAACIRALARLQSIQEVTEGLKHVKDGVMILGRFRPWIETLLELDPEGKVKFVVWFDDNSGTYRIQGTPLTKGRFGNKVDLVDTWGGLSREELIRETGIEDIVFVHNCLFIGGAESLESCLLMAKLSLEHHARKEAEAIERLAHSG